MAQRLTLIIWLVALLVPVLHAQEVPEFEMDAVVVRGETVSRDARVDVYVSVPYNRLTFLNTTDGFTATYEVTADAYRLDDRDRRLGVAQTRIWEQQVITTHFARTRAETLSDRTSHALELPPGRYLIHLQVRDRASDRRFIQEMPLQVRRLDRPVAVSDLVLLESYEAENNRITPVIGRRLGTEAGGFKIFYELYSDRAREVSVSQQVLRVNSAGAGIMRTIFSLGRDSGQDPGEVTFQRADAKRLTSGRNPTVVEIPLADLRTGEYLIRVQLADASGDVLDEAEKVVTVEWSGLDEHIRDLDEAIDQLTYIAKDREIEYIRSAATTHEKLARFREFWDKRDPTPNSRRNERMEEYYYRIDYANRRFTHLRDGWKTDRGNVMVLFGEPDFVESQPLNFSIRPYEVWYYYRIGRRFVFIDRSGMGDYELVVPIWDERTRIR